MNPIYFANAPNSLDLNAGPLSDLIMFGTVPNSLKIFLNISIVWRDVRPFDKRQIGYLEYSHIKIRPYSFEGSLLVKSIDVKYNLCGGSSVGIIGGVTV